MPMPTPPCSVSAVAVTSRSGRRRGPEEDGRRVGQTSQRRRISARPSSAHQRGATISVARSAHETTGRGTPQPQCHCRLPRSLRRGDRQPLPIGPAPRCPIDPRGRPSLTRRASGGGLSRIAAALADDRRDATTLTATNLHPSHICLSAWLTDPTPPFTLLPVCLRLPCASVHSRAR